MTDQRARELWKAITDEMFLAKRSGMTPRELAVFTDRRAVEILLTALADERRRVLDEAANVVKRKTHEPWKSDAIKREGLRLVQAIRAKAHAGQEASHD